MLPGEHDITYTYKFPYQDDSVAFSQRLIQGAELYQVLAPVALSQIQVSPLEGRPRIDVGGVTYLVWEAREIPPGPGVALRFSNLPQPSLASRLVRTAKGVELWITVIPALLAVLLAALLCWAWFRGAKSRNCERGRGAKPGKPARQSLVQAVALLDDGFERGQVAADEYRPRRAELMAELRRLTAPTGGEESSP